MTIFISGLCIQFRYRKNPIRQRGGGEPSLTEDTVKYSGFTILLKLVSDLVLCSQ